MTNIALSLTINKIKSSFSVPIRAHIHCPFQHLHFNMNVHFSFKIFTHAFFNGWIKSFTVFDINFVGFPLTSILTELCVIAWENELKKLFIMSAPHCADQLNEWILYDSDGTTLLQSNSDIIIEGSG